MNCLSRNDAIGRALSPHPSPLPKGEGETAKGNFEQQCRKKVYLAEALVRLSTEAGKQPIICVGRWPCPASQSLNSHRDGGGTRRRGRLRYGAAGRLGAKQNRLRTLTSLLGNGKFCTLQLAGFCPGDKSCRTFYE